MVARKGENCGRKEGGELRRGTMVARKGENYGGKPSQVKFLSIGLWPFTRKGENYGGKEGGELTEGLLWCYSRREVW